MSRVLYLLMVVAAGWAVTFGLRALPFLLFAGKDRELPRWVEKLGNIVSPVIIGGLIIYSYATLKIGEGETAVSAWKTVWPYLAGFLTIGLQLLWRNSLVSIIAGTALYMFFVAGCTTVREVEYGVDHPLLELSVTGLKFDGKYTKPEDVPDLLEEYQIPKTAVIHIAVTPEVQKNLKPVRTFMGYLAMKGWRRSVLVTSMHGESEVVEGRRGYGGSSAAPAAKPKIRYKGAKE